MREEVGMGREEEKSKVMGRERWNVGVRNEK